MKKKLGLMALIFCVSATTFADNSFSWNGYMRSSLGFNSNLEDKSGTDINTLGRFGNEYDDYISSNFSKKWDGKNGTWAQYTFGLNAIDSLNPNPTIGKNFIQMGGFDFLPKESSIWIGKKSIDSSVDILDYKYRNINGRGFGYTSKTLDLSFYKELHPSTGETDDAATIDGVYRIGNFETEVTFTKIAAEGTTTDESKKGDTSVSALVAYKAGTLLGFLPGKTTYRVQYGNGVLAEKLNYSNVTNKDDTAYRFTIDGTYFNEDWIINPVILVEGSHYGTKDVNSSTATIATRATNKLSENLSMVYEAAIATKENESGTSTNDGTEYKIAVGPALQLNTVPYTKPVIRLSTTLIGGDKEVTQLTKDSELRFGAQFETWF